MNKFKSITLLSLAVGLFLQSCSNDDSSITEPENRTYAKGIFILNEGNFNSTDAEITYYNPLTEVAVGKNPIQNIFKTENNGATLGSVGQSFYFKGEKAYISLSGSNRIQVVNNTTFKTITSITGNLNNPRYITSDNEHLYVSNWGDPKDTKDDYISVYKLNDLTYVTKYNVAEGPEKMLLDNDKLYVAQKGGWGFGNSVSIIDLKTGKIQPVEVSDVPVGIEKEGNTLYVLCQGVSWGNITSGALHKINITSLEKETLHFNQGEHPDFLVKSNNTLYFTIGKSIYSMPIAAKSLPAKADFTTNATQIYGLDVKDNFVYVMDAKGFTQNGALSIYDQTGTLQRTVETGIGPNSIYIK